ncbi:MAG: helix-turn-helix domain-containing protein [Ruminococcaceae bacterium]|nr:helix-turn-helix domain-containing protein [Oscillospiraceae bacterium]
MNAHFSSQLLSLRQAKGLSRKAVGQALSVSSGTVAKWEQGLSLPSADKLVPLSRLLGISVDALLTAPETDETVTKPTDGMPSLSELYKIGSGPSSSHTIGPEKAALTFRAKYPEADHFEVVLYGSLAKTGEGHGTDRIVTKTLAPLPCRILFDKYTEELPHPNTMLFLAYRGTKEIGRARIFSVGGGAIQYEGDILSLPERIYPLHTFADIAAYCEDHHLRLWEYAEQIEGEALWAHLSEIWEAMKASIQTGLKDTGELPGGLGVKKKARHLFHLQHIDETSETKENRLISAYAFAVGEQNACGGRIVTAPTCGAAGVVPAVLYYQQKKHRFRDDAILRALATGGIVGNLIKTNASISGAECGCQAEIGSACAMAAAAMAELFELSIDKIEYAAEISIEHHLGLTCDPICGLVQIPCIERNAVAAMRAINAVNLSTFLSDTRKISFDKVVLTMKETGEDLHHRYRETSEGGLAKLKV